jgi:hypothetical protein
MSSLSLMSIMREDPDFGKRISKKVEEIKQDKQNLLHLADDYGQRYQDEILEGTEKRANLLTEGKSRGLTEDEIMSTYKGFLPTVYTPLLNLLYFMLRESDNDPYYGDNHYQQRNKLNEQFGHLKEEDVKSEVLKETPEMIEYLYGSITLDTFNKIKKLKALSKSPNEQEAFQAYRKANELCKQYNLDFDRIPCYVSDKK